MSYLDTSVIVAALTQEATTARIQTWLSAQAPGSLSVSEWVRTEVSSALALKLRTGQIEANHRASALAAFTQLAANSFVVLPVSAASFRAAAGFVDRADLGLRAGDALHLAIAAEHGEVLFTLDRRFADAANQLGVQAQLL
jgi:predicted nucleic acid-binding protein